MPGILARPWCTNRAAGLISRPLIVPNSRNNPDNCKPGPMWPGLLFLQLCPRRAGMTFRRRACPSLSSYAPLGLVWERRAIVEAGREARSTDGMSALFGSIVAGDLQFLTASCIQIANPQSGCDAMQVITPASASERPQGGICNLSVVGHKRSGTGRRLIVLVVDSLRPQSGICNPAQPGFGSAIREFPPTRHGSSQKRRPGH